MPHTLYVLNNSHPCATAERALQLKGQPYRIHEMAPALHVPEQWLRFRATTVPTLRLGNGEKIVGSRAIVHRLDQLVPEPRLLPADAAARARVLEAERWGDEVLQPVPRRLAWTGVCARPDALASYSEGSRLPLPGFVQRLAAPRIARVARWRNRGGEQAARKDLAALPAQLDKVDAWIAEGVLGGAEPNAADLQIAPSIRLLATMEDVRPLLAGRPCLDLAMRLFPSYGGHMPSGALPAAA
ncbi:MAG TPA: glutathione S-transferase family protein [Conexibacter sp.]|nr:glutathione S-transferase family protein [Conexibacter sp.]